MGLVLPNVTIAPPLAELSTILRRELPIVCLVVRMDSTKMTLLMLVCCVVGSVLLVQGRLLIALPVDFHNMGLTFTSTSISVCSPVPSVSGATQQVIIVMPAILHVLVVTHQGPMPVKVALM